MSMNKFIVPAALGLSLVTVTAFVIYYIFKDEREGEGRAIKTSKVSVIEVNVPKSIVPALIGRSGSNIKDIEKKSGALIHFKKFSDKEYDVCIIRGRNDATQLAETMIHEFMRQQPDIVEDTMTVPSWACGRIIGTGGENIKDISHMSGARVKIESGLSTDNNIQRNITFKGTKEQINNAKRLIDNCVAQEKCRREIEQSRRSPRHGSATPTATSPTSATSPTQESPGDLAHKRVKYKRPEAGGSLIEVYVSAVSSPSRFWVQLVGVQVSQLDDLVNTMTDYYSNKENRDAHALAHVSVGQVVAAVFRHDGRWYRARVHDIRPNEFDSTKQVADVFYLDYGDSEYVATHELCELRADLLRLRFQAMECFLAGVRPAGKPQDTVAVSPTGQRWDKWHPQAIERFEELTQVARWKPLVSRTCTYRKTATEDGEKEKEIPGIKLFDVTEEGEMDIGAVLISEGWACEAPPSPRASPPRVPAPHTPSTPFGDLGNSRVLSMLSGDSTRASSVPKDHKDDRSELNSKDDAHNKSEIDKMTSSKSLASGMDNSNAPKSISNFAMSYPEATNHLNGSHDEFLNSERNNVEKESSTDTLVAHSSPKLAKSTRDEFKANMNRIDSHHSNLETLGRHDK